METRLRSAARTTAGRRPGQEDAILVRPLAGGMLLAVADGMGGHAAGEIASGLAVKALEDAGRRLGTHGDPGEALGAAARDANRAILKHAGEHPEAEGLGTTLVAAVVRGGRLFVGHAGDSRAWLVTGADIRLLTRDHSAVQDAIDRGDLDADQARRSPYRNAILRNLGDPAFPGLEFSSPPEGWALSHGCAVLLTSDGAHGHLTEADLLDRLAGTPTLELALEHLMRLAYHRGSDDNISLVACEHGELSRSRHRVAPPPPIPRRPLERAGGRTAPSPHVRRIQIASAVVFALVVVALAVQLVREVRPEWLPRKWPGPSSLSAPAVSTQRAPANTVRQREWAPPVPPDTSPAATERAGSATGPAESGGRRPSKLLRPPAGGSERAAAPVTVPLESAPVESIAPRAIDVSGPVGSSAGPNAGSAQPDSASAHEDTSGAQ